MIQLHFILNIEDIQNLINAEFKNDTERTILTRVFNTLMENDKY